MNQEQVRHRKWQKELKRKKVRKFTKKLTLATRIYNKTAGKALKHRANFLADYKQDKETLTPEALKGKYGDILNNVIETNKLIRKGVINTMDSQTPNDPSHAVPGIDVNNPPAKKVRLDADVVGNNPIEGIKTPSANLEVNQPAPTRDGDNSEVELPADLPPTEAPEAPEAPIEEDLEPEVEDEVPPAPAQTEESQPAEESEAPAEDSKPEEPVKEEVQPEAPAETEASKPEEEAPKQEETTSAQ